VDSESSLIYAVLLTVQETLPANTSVTYWLSNNGGERWYLAQPGHFFTFPSFGTDLHWRVELRSLSPVQTPRLEQLSLALSETDEVCGVGVGEYSLGEFQPITVTVETAGTLDCLAADYFPVDHPNAIANAGLSTDTGAYWMLKGLDSSGAQANDFMVTISLPHTAMPHVDAKVCRYFGVTGWYSWDCERTNSTDTMVWRENVTSFSDWAVGENIEPVAVSLVTSRARYVGTASRWWLAGVLGLGVVMALRVFISRGAGRARLD
jgi:hypothetical protein